MKHSYFVEIITLGLFLIMFFNWLKIYIRVKLWLRSFIRNHIAQRVNPDLDLNLPLLAKEQPTGIKNSNLIQDPDDKFILMTDPSTSSLSHGRVYTFKYNERIGTTQPNAE